MTTPPSKKEIKMIKIYVDGACKGNPGPCGAAVVAVVGDRTLQYQFCAPMGTNNVAELEAVYRALWLVKKLPEECMIISDSAYAVGMADQGWKAKENLKMVKKVRELRYEVGLKAQFLKIKGHGSNVMNTLADKLASDAALMQIGRSFKLLEEEK